METHCLSDTVYRDTCAHKSVAQSADSVPLPSQIATHVSICSPWTGATLHQPGTANCLFSAIRIWTVAPINTPARPPLTLPAHCQLSSEPTLARKLLKKTNKNTGLAADAGGRGRDQCFIAQLVDTGPHCWRITRDISLEKSTLNLISTYVSLMWQQCLRLCLTTFNKTRP